MKRIGWIGAAVLLAALGTAVAQVPSTISYQGFLRDATGVAVPDGAHDFTFRIYDTPSGLIPLWAEAHALVPVEGGAFSVVLGQTVPFALAFDRVYYLGVSVDTDGELSPRAPLSSVPYSLTAKTVENGSVTAAKIGAGQVVKSLNSLTDTVTLSGGGQVSVGAAGNVITVSAPEGWRLTGNGGTSAATHFIGTTDAQPVEMRVNGQRALRLEPDGVPPGVVARVGTDGVWSAGQKRGVSFGDGEGVYLGEKDGNNTMTLKADRFFFEGGNLGVGTSSPAQRLHVAGLAEFDVGGGQVNVSTPGGWPGIIAFSANGHRRDVTWDDTSMALTVSGSAAAPARTSGINVLENGNVGIGTQNPVARLSVQGDLYVTGAVRGNLGSNGGGPFPRPAYDSGWVPMDADTTLTHNLGGNTDSYVVDLEFQHNEGIEPYVKGVYGPWWDKVDSGASGLVETGGFWSNLTTTSIRVRVGGGNFLNTLGRVRIWVYN